MIKAVFFDLDDTLYDHTGIVEDTLHTLKIKLPLIQDLPDSDISALYHEVLEKYHRYYIEGKYPFEEAHRLRWAAMLEHWKIADVDAEEMRLYWREQYFRNQKLVAGARALLEAIRKQEIAVGIVTNNSVTEQVGKLQACKIDHLVDHLVVSEEAGVSKPDERIYLIALERASVQTSEAVMVGDHWENDILAPMKIGMPSIWFNRKRLAPPIPVKQIHAFEPVAEVAATMLLATQ